MTLDDSSDSAPEPEEVEGEVLPPTDSPDQSGRSDVGRRIAALSQFSGPLPPPKHLREYDEVHPGLAGIIVEQWTKETAHRQRTIDRLGETDHQAMQLFYRGERRGQALGFVLFVLVLLVAAYAIYAGFQLLGLAGILASTAPVIWSMRRSSAGDAPPEPVDLADGNEVERSPDTAPDA